MISVTVESADSPGVSELLEASDVFHAELYPPDENFLLDASSLAGATVVVARFEGEAVGMGCLVEAGDGTAELKRFFVLPEHRGGGIAGRVLETLVAVAGDHRLHLLRLETGDLQHAAIAFYERHGFARMELFGEYVDSPSSVCMAREL